MEMHINANKEPGIDVLHRFDCDFISASVCYIAADSHVAMTTIYAPLRGSLQCKSRHTKSRAAVRRVGTRQRKIGGGGGRSHTSEKTLSEMTMQTNPCDL